MVTTSIKTQFVLRDGVIRYEKSREFYEPGSSSHSAKILIDSIIMDFEDHPLCEVSTDTLKLLRDSGKPGFVLKKDGKYYYSAHPRLPDYQYMHDGLKGCRSHMCNEKSMICKRLCALPDSMGGCAKIRDEDSVIEKYDFITEGYEFFNLSTQSAFVVLDCENWKPSFTANQSSNDSQDTSQE